MSKLFLVGFCVALTSAPVWGQEASPLSAIDWLSQSVTTSEAVDPAVQTPVSEPPVANSASAPTINVSPLGAASADPIGLFSSAATGLPRDLWSGSDADTVAMLLAGQNVDGLPATQELLRLLILAEADAPAAAGAENALFLARIDKLLDMGALSPALAMLDLVDTKAPPVFRRWFDVALLTGDEDSACTYMQQNPSTAPTSTTRIFCLARNGDWPAAALTLNTHVALGDIDDDTAELLARFLDPDLFEGEPPLPAPERVTPLIFRMREAVGEALPTPAMPRAFAHADLRSAVGWKSQLEAAERLTRSAAIGPNRLQGFYLARRPAASGGVWDRVDAVQRLDTAITSGSYTAIAHALPDAWASMVAARTEVAFAKLYGADLIASGVDHPLVRNLALLSPDYEVFAQSQTDPDFAETLAMGTPRGAQGDLERAIEAAFTDPAPDPTLTALFAQGKLGEALLQSLASFNAATFDYVSLTEVLSFWRSVGFEDLARRAALQRLILKRPT